MEAARKERRQPRKSIIQSSGAVAIANLPLPLKESSTDPVATTQPDQGLVSSVVRSALRVVPWPCVVVVQLYARPPCAVYHGGRGSCGPGIGSRSCSNPAPSGTRTECQGDSVRACNPTPCSSSTGSSSVVSSSTGNTPSAVPSFTGGSPSILNASGRTSPTSLVAFFLASVLLLARSQA